jgi:hypothetical protein
MKLQNISKVDGDNTYSFPIDGRTSKEVKIAKDCGYMELPRFKGANKPRTDCYACASCKAWQKREFTMPEHPSTHDGWCNKYLFRDRDYGVCSGYLPKTGLFSYNPA